MCIDSLGQMSRYAVCVCVCVCKCVCVCVCLVLMTVVCYVRSFTESFEFRNKSQSVASHVTVSDGAVDGNIVCVSE